MQDWVQVLKGRNTWNAVDVKEHLWVGGVLLGLLLWVGRARPT